MRRLILENKLPAEYQITEQDLAKRLDMSRTPVREAMARLAAEGLVEVIPRHGMRVLPVSVEDVAEIYQVLTGLEATAAAIIAAGKLKKGPLGELRQCLLAMDRSLQSRDIDSWAEADEQFHKQLVAMAGNRRLSSVVESCLDQSKRVRLITLPMRPEPSQSMSEHRAILAAIEAGDAEGARALVYNHRHRNGQALIKLVKQSGAGAL